MLTPEEREGINVESIQIRAVEIQRELIESVDGKDGWTPVQGWPQTFLRKGVLGKPIMLTVYVDDMVMSGPGHKCEWARLCKLVKTTKPHPIDRVLGVNFTSKRLDENKGEFKMDMHKYTEQTVDAYLGVDSAILLKPKVSHTWY